MKVGKFQIGRYHAIIRKSYADGSVDYETSFSDHADLMESVYCLRLCIGKMVGLATDTPKVLTRRLLFCLACRNFRTCR